MSSSPKMAARLTSKMVFDINMLKLSKRKSVVVRVWIVASCLPGGSMILQPA